MSRILPTKMKSMETRESFRESNKNPVREVKFHAKTVTETYNGKSK